MMSDYAKALGEVVYRERKAQKITQAQLAELVGTTEQTIRKIEHGNSNLQMSVLFPLLRALHIDPVEVFYPEAAQERSAKRQLDMLVAQAVYASEFFQHKTFYTNENDYIKLIDGIYDKIAPMLES